MDGSLVLYPRNKHGHKLILLLCLFISLPGCYHWFISYYDPTTYKNLTDLKPEVMVLYDSFGSEPLNASAVSATRLRLAQVYEYEKGKGAKNLETTAQIQKIREMFERHVNDRFKNGKWNETHLGNNKQNIAEAFDIAIQSERLKNKNE